MPRKHIDFRVANTTWHQVNLYRHQKNVPPLVEDKRLSEAAHLYAAFLAENNRKDGAPTIHHADGRDPTERAQAQGFQCPVRENVAATWGSPSVSTNHAQFQALSFWKGSANHERTMSDPSLIYTGLGVAAWIHGSEEIYHFVQLFSEDCPNPVPGWQEQP